MGKERCEEKGGKYWITLYGLDYVERQIESYEHSEETLTIPKNHFKVQAEDWRPLLQEASGDIVVERGSIIVKVPYDTEEKAKAAFQSIDLVNKDYSTGLCEAISDKDWIDGSVALLSAFLPDKVAEECNKSALSIELSFIPLSGLVCDSILQVDAIRYCKLLYKYLRCRYSNRVFPRYFEFGSIFNFQKDGKDCFFSSITEGVRETLEASPYFKKKSDDEFAFIGDKPSYILQSKGIDPIALVEDCTTFLKNLLGVAGTELQPISSGDEFYWISGADEDPFIFDDGVRGRRLILFEDVTIGTIEAFYKHLESHKELYRELEVIGFQSISKLTKEIVKWFTDVEIEGGKLHTIYVGGCGFTTGRKELIAFEKSLWATCERDRLMTACYLPDDHPTPYYTFTSQISDIETFISSLFEHIDMGDEEY